MFITAAVFFWTIFIPQSVESEDIEAIDTEGQLH